MFPAPELLAVLALPAPAARGCPLLGSALPFVGALTVNFRTPPESRGGTFWATDAAAQVMSGSSIEQRRAMPTNESDQITEGIVLASLRQVKN